MENKSWKQYQEKIYVSESFNSLKKYIESQEFFKLSFSIYVFELFTYCNSEVLLVSIE